MTDVDKQCRYCKRSLPEGGEFTLTICGTVIQECLICSLVRNDVIRDYWGHLSPEIREEIRVIKTYFEE